MGFTKFKFLKLDYGDRNLEILWSYNLCNRRFNKMLQIQKPPLSIHAPFQINRKNPDISNDLIEASGAVFDVTGTYRYTLWRVWNINLPRVVFIMLNPSTADATTDDPTIRRCIRFAQSWGYGALEVVNLFAYCTSDPIQLKRVADPIGQENDQYLLQVSDRAQILIAGWGNEGGLRQRSQTVLHLLTPKSNLFCLGINQTQQPRHPLYVKQNTLPQLYVGA